MICVWAAPPTCVSRGLRAYQGVYAHTQGLTCERTMWLSGRYHPGQAPNNVVEQPIPPGTAQNADHFAISSPFSAFFTEVVCVLGATLPRTAAAPPPIWGNCAMQGCDTPATRRQKALHGAKPPPPPVASALQGGREGLAAAPVGGGGAWPGFETTRQHAKRRRCGGRRRVRRARAGFEAGPGCGARGRWRGLAGLRDDAPSRRLAARTSRGRAAAHGHTKQPGPRDRPHGARNTRGATSRPSSAGH